MKTIIAAILVIMLNATCIWAKTCNDAIQVNIVTDSGNMLTTYPVKHKKGISKVYAEAVKGEQYRIQVTNRLNRRVGLVIAVDGRNIISGSRSWLKNSERMYILEPYGSGEFSGWRSNQDRINRFYFTDVPDSYAAAFGDESAMGIITVAAYPEQETAESPLAISNSRPLYKNSQENRAADSSSGSRAAAPAAAPATDKREKKAAADKTMESAGTGYGRSEYSPTYTVEFKPVKQAVHTTFIKYEWHSTLCRLGVISCNSPVKRPFNRLWDNNGYAPPPPGH